MASFPVGLLGCQSTEGMLGKLREPFFTVAAPVIRDQQGSANFTWAVDVASCTRSWVVGIKYYY